MWSVISGTTCRCDKDIVQDEIKNATEIRTGGFAYFKPFTEESLQKVNKTKPPPKMYTLISKLAPLLVSIKKLFIITFQNLKINALFVIYLLEFGCNNSMGPGV